jgi:uncharacterized protein (TIGR02266 family)
LGEALELTRSPPPASGRPRRACLDGVVRIRCQGRRGLHTGFLRDLSLGGMFVRILDPELPGSRIDFDLDLELAGRSRRISGRGEVVWSRSGYEGPSRPPGMGVRFLDLAEAARQMLRQALGGGGGEVDEEGPLIDPLVPPEDAWRASSSASERSAPLRGDDRRAAAHRRWVAPALLSAAALAGALLIHRGPEQIVPKSEAPTPLARRDSAPMAATDALSSRPSVELAEHLPSPLLSAPADFPAPELLPVSPVQGPGPWDPFSEGVTRLVGPEGGRLEERRLSSEPRRAAPMSRLTGISWELVPGGTVLTLAGDGVPDASWIHSSGIGGDHPRRLIRLLGVVGEPGRVEVASAELIRVRTGYHQRGEGELHVVLDLATAEVVVSPPELFEQGFRLTLRSGDVDPIDE